MALAAKESLTQDGVVELQRHVRNMPGMLSSLNDKSAKYLRSDRTGGRDHRRRGPPR